jgi:mannose-6-phosphate isomerase-like protein (cupin superfamily)
MAGYTKVNLKADVENMAPKFNMEGIESRFARRNLELANSGLSYYRLDPDYRFPFGHTHSEQEEIYVLLSGMGRVAVGDEVVDMSPWDAIRIAPGETRGFEAGPDGAEILAFGAPNTDNKDVDMQPGWWPGERAAG